MSILKSCLITLKSQIKDWSPERQKCKKSKPIEALVIDF